MTAARDVFAIQPSTLCWPVVPQSDWRATGQAAFLPTGLLTTIGALRKARTAQARWQRPAPRGAVPGA